MSVVASYFFEENGSLDFFEENGSLDFFKEKVDRASHQVRLCIMKNLRDEFLPKKYRKLN